MRAAAAEIQLGAESPVWAVFTGGGDTRRAKCCDRSNGGREPKVPNAAPCANDCEPRIASIDHRKAGPLRKSNPSFVCCACKPECCHLLLHQYSSFYEDSEYLLARPLLTREQTQYLSVELEVAIEAIQARKGPIIVDLKLDPNKVPRMRI